ncbi:MAG: hypothetical protein ACK5LT_13225 [Lachnospirales bacterium]
MLGTFRVNAQQVEICKSNVEKEQDLQSLKDLDEKYDFINFDNISERNKYLRSNDNIETLEFDTIEEFENFLEIMESEQGIQKLPDVYIGSYNLEQGTTRRTTTYNGVSTGRKHIPFVNAGTGLFCWMNTDVSYKYAYKNSKPYFISATNASSYITGISLSSWTQTSKVQNVTRGNISTTVKGTYYIGIAVKGFNVGATSKGSYSWNTYFK